MTAKISPELLRECERTEQTEPQREIPVIITVTDWARRSELDEKGLRVSHAFENISAIAGTLTCAEVEAVAQLDQVEIIEFDGEVRIASVSDA
jgi:hypothetical protein